MKHLLATTALIAMGFAAQAQTADFAARVAADLAAQGYTDIETEIEGDTTVIEGSRDGVSFEFIYDTATEALLETLEEAEDDEIDDDQDDDDQDEDQDDDAEDDDDDEEDDDEDEDGDEEDDD